MPNVVFYREEDGSVPLGEWFADLPQKARVQCIAKIELSGFKAMGSGVRTRIISRAVSTELRAKAQGINCRMLYFFHGRQAIVLSHGIVKQRAAVPPIDIERARLRSMAFAADPARHTHEEP